MNLNYNQNFKSKCFNGVLYFKNFILNEYNYIYITCISFFSLKDLI